MKMELQSLVLGLVFSLGLYAMKAGVGLQYYLEQEDRRGRRLAVFCAFLAAYGLLFAALAALVRRLELAAHFQSVQTFLQSGMLIHFALAALMLFWGVALLKTRQEGKKKSLGWLALVLPCPVCFTMVFISVAFLVAYFPDAWKQAVLLLSGIFLALALMTTLLLARWRRRAAGSPEAALGAAMVVISAYFLLSVLIMPQFAGLDEAFRLSAYSHQETQAYSLTPWATAGGLGILFILGYLHMRSKTRRS